MLASLFEVAGESTPWGWLLLGYGGQAVFGTRFYVQWVVSERQRKSVMPVIFWWLSLLGSAMTLIYALYRWDGPFILANLGGPPIYARNLWLIHKAHKPLDTAPPVPPPTGA
jgi:lipid-A-disaccharide synthase-like uncharacterized protein